MSPQYDENIILLAHGDGGALTHELITGIFLKHLGNNTLNMLTDAAEISVKNRRLAVTTDSFVVKPIFFPGGDIGKLAVCGTVNDLAVSGADPLYLTASFILEEGFPISQLEEIAKSMAAASAEIGVKVVAGDTKVIEKGHADGIFINTTGLGVIPRGVKLGYRRVKPGDVLIVSGTLGDHGLAILTSREGLGISDQLKSDCNCLYGIIQVLMKSCSPEKVKLMRDLTRGGFATAAKEIAVSAGVDILVDEENLPISPIVRGAAEILGLDPIYLANEGKFLAIVNPDTADAALKALRSHPLGKEANIVGQVKAGKGNVYIRTAVGGTKIVEMLAGSPLPRIC